MARGAENAASTLMRKKKGCLRTAGSIERPTASRERGSRKCPPAVLGAKREFQRPPDRHRPLQRGDAVGKRVCPSLPLEEAGGHDEARARPRGLRGSSRKGGDSPRAGSFFPISLCIVTDSR